MRKLGRVRKSLRYSFLDGTFASCMVGLTTDYVAPYALALKASLSQISFLSAAPNLISSLAQLKTPDLVEKVKSRKKIINFFVLMHVFMGLPIILAPYLFKTHAVLFLILFVTLFSSFQAIAGPAWASLMSDYIPVRSRGRYFGWRSKTLGVITITCAFIAGLVLHYFKNNILKGFMVIFSAAVICRFISWCFLTRMHEPQFIAKEESYFSFLDFIRRIKESNFAKFVLFVATLNFCVNLASPFFSVFMLKDLKFNYLTYTIVVTAVTIAQIFSIDRWGKHADKIGNIKVLRLTSFFIATLPFWWIINQHPLYLVAVQVAAGFSWSGFNLCATNFIYDAVTPEKRTRCIAYFNVCSGVALCCGALMGGYLVNILPPLFGYRILSLFLLSSILRFSVVSFISRKIREVRHVEAITSKELFYSMVGIKPLLGVTQDSRQVIRMEE